MSGWNYQDKNNETDTGTEFPCQNNITMRGQLPSDMVPSPRQSKTIVEAHLRSLRAYRKWCRYMPFIVAYNGLFRMTNVEQAKLQLARTWRQQNRQRSIENLDRFSTLSAERLYNMQQGDIWGGLITDWICPTDKGNWVGTHGLDQFDEKVYKGKTDFLKGFYKGDRPQ